MSAWFEGYWELLIKVYFFSCLSRYKNSYEFAQSMIHITLVCRHSLWRARYIKLVSSHCAITRSQGAFRFLAVGGSHVFCRCRPQTSGRCRSIFRTSSGYPAIRFTSASDLRRLLHLLDDFIKCYLRDLSSYKRLSNLPAFQPSLSYETCPNRCN